MGKQTNTKADQRAKAMERAIRAANGFHNVVKQAIEIGILGQTDTAECVDYDDMMEDLKRASERFAQAYARAML